MSMRINNPDQFLKAFENELKEILQGELSREVSNDIDTYFLEKKWLWNGNLTKRKNGETVGSPRDIFDLGDLYFSERESFSFIGNEYQMTRTWGGEGTDADHAVYVHDGTAKTEARRWTDRIAENHEQEYADLIERRITEALNRL